MNASSRFSKQRRDVLDVKMLAQKKVTRALYYAAKRGRLAERMPFGFPGWVGKNMRAVIMQAQIRFERQETRRQKALAN